MGDIIPLRPDVAQVPDRAHVPARAPMPERAPERERAPLWREALGRSLRSSREEQGSRLVDVAERAGISPQYLSEIERGRKEPSSEMIEAVAGALGTDLAGVLHRVSRQLHSRPMGPVLRAA